MPCAEPPTLALPRTTRGGDKIACGSWRGSLICRALVASALQEGAEEAAGVVYCVLEETEAHFVVGLLAADDALRGVVGVVGIVGGVVVFGLEIDDGALRNLDGIDVTVLVL